MGLKDSFTDVGMKAMNAAHRGIRAVSGGRIGGKAFGMPALELHTTGRTSGKRRTVMLTAPVVDGETVVLVASKGGDDRHPDWYRNLSAEPKVEITLDGTTRAYVARTATAEEKAALWPRITSAYKGYAGYQKRTDRDIPVVLCEPA